MFATAWACLQFSTGRSRSWGPATSLSNNNFNVMQTMQLRVVNIAIFGNKPVYTQTLLPQGPFYIETFLHTDTSTHKWLVYKVLVERFLQSQAF